ncbi:DUF4275 family protein [Brevibacillus reuszeri]|uniref:DUF4275 family protein n=1 Tax=Brevibacillus reuszeri TaxID=54915 RepID=UPI003D1F23B8
MRLNVVEKESIFIVGIEVDIDFDWDEFLETPDPILLDIANVVESNTYYYVSDSEKYIFGKQVSVITQIPEGCVVVKVPSGLYAKIHRSQTRYEHDMFAMTNYEWIEKVQFRTITPRPGNNNVEHVYRPVEYLQDVVNIRKIAVQPNEISNQLREQYTNKFFDVNSNCVREFLYRRYVTQHNGYLWNFIKKENKEKKEGLTISKALDFLRNKEKPLFFWDATSEVGREFTRNKVFTMEAKELLQSYTRFTFDLYIFDSTMTWTIIFQHEPDDQICDCFLIKD